MNKTMYFSFEAAETGFDPAAYSDLYSNIVIANMMETLLEFDYLSRPTRVVPGTAAAMPEVLDGGRTYIFHLRKGIYFAPHEVFGGKKRELTAQDYVYSLLRLVDPSTKRPNAWLLRGKVIGLDEKLAEYKKTKQFDPNVPVEGLKALDRYTLQIKLKKPDYDLPYIMAMPSTVAMAKEIVDKYGDQDAGAHPVGTGPYMLKQWERGHRMVLEANPNFRGLTYAPPADAKGVDQNVANQLKGKVLPLIGTIDIRIIESGQAQYLDFLRGGQDILVDTKPEYAALAAPGGKLDPKLVKKGIRSFTEQQPEIVYNHFNMDDPVVGGYTPEKVALRRAFTMSYNSLKEAMVLRNGQAIEAQGPWSPGIVGYDASFKNPFHAYNPARANAILDTYGYKDVDGDGYRERPDGKPLEVEYLGTAGSGRELEEQILNAFRDIKIRARTVQVSFPDLIQRRQNGKYQLAGGAWIADYPDVDNFLQLLYGPNTGEGNDARFKLPEFDRLYDDITAMPDSPERQKKVMRMVRLASAYAPWNFNVHRIRTHFAQGWTTGFAKHPFDHVKFMYYDIDLAKREAYKKQQ
ncbi:ABC transporter substrate-binding protein [Chitinivorax sp. PXF-14]|uniref:ABC transporter substrate-binding protein n=1 Tax=Chitinivorax sp. PXF-14 TaxID=3230488 RepID=UPI003466EEAE